MIVDAHAHLDPHEVTGEDYVRLMDASGVDRVVLLASLNGPIPPTPDWQVGIMRFLLQSPLKPIGKRIYESLVQDGFLQGGGKKIRIVRDPDNDSVARVLASRPDRFLAFVTVNPKLANALEVFERGIEEQGMAGVKCHSWWHGFDPAADMLPIARRCEEKGLPLLIHLGGGPRTGDFESLLAKCPRLKLILAHAAIPHFRSAWPIIREHPGCFVDISGSYLNASLVRKTVAALGPHKVIFGSDGPVSLRREGGHSYEPILGWTRALSLSDRERDRIMSGNLISLLP